jgi:hypothetical protein
MITRPDIYDVLTKCTGYDSAHAPKPSAIVIDAWMEHFEDFPNVTRDDVLRAVKEYHKVPRDQQLQPSHISAIARVYSRDRYERSELDSVERQRHEQLCDGKATDDDPQLAIEASERATTVRSKIDAYAGMFGLTGRQAQERLRARETAGGELAYRQALIAQQRRAGPPAALPSDDEQEAGDG